MSIEPNPRTVACGSCGRPIDESPGAPPENRVPCPDCGSLARRVDIRVEDTITIHDSLAIKVKRGGKGKPVRTGKYGDSLHTLTGRWMHREMTVDRENDRYTERIVDPESGEVIRDVDERLSDHRGHGDAKPPR
jgi:hypothetical protein